MQRRIDAGCVQESRQHPPVIQPDREIAKAQRDQHVADRGAQLGLDHHRARTDRIHVALVELAEAAARRPIGAPHGLNLIPLEELRQLAAILGDNACERHRQIVTKRKIGFPGRFMLAAAEHLENQLVAFFAVLPRERLDVLQRRRLERLEAVPPGRRARRSPITYSRRRTSSGRKSRMPRAGRVCCDAIRVRNRRWRLCSVEASVDDTGFATRDCATRDSRAATS